MKWAKIRLTVLLSKRNLRLIVVISQRLPEQGAYGSFSKGLTICFIVKDSDLYAKMSYLKNAVPAYKYGSPLTLRVRVLRKSPFLGLSIIREVYLEGTWECTFSIVAPNFEATCQIAFLFFVFCEQANIFLLRWEMVCYSQFSLAAVSSFLLMFNLVFVYHFSFISVSWFV